MDKYIKESELFKRILNVDFKHDYDGCIKFCQSVPAADVAEVVRCGECKHYDRRRDVCHNPRWGDGWANYPSPSVNEDFSCADGAKMEVEHE